MKTITGLARLCQAQARYPETEALFLGALQARRDVLGEQHPETNASRRDLAPLMSQWNRTVEAITWLEDAVEHGESDLAAFRQPDLARLRGHPEFEAIVAEIERNEGEWPPRKRGVRARLQSLRGECGR